MGLIRLVIFALVIWLVWRMIKNYQATLRQKRNKNASDKKLSGDAMVACHYCKVHVPEKIALEHDNQWFCSSEHRDKYLADNSR